MKIFEELQKRILVLDGAMGTMIQGYNLTEEDFRGIQFKDSKIFLKGNNEVLNLSQPNIIKDIHYKYLLAGSDIIETNTLNANIISQSDYNLSEHVYEINKHAANIGRLAILDYLNSNPPKTIFLAGSIGPTNKSASLSPDISNPILRNITFDQLVYSYEEQIRGLIEGGVDLLLIETVTDCLNARAALIAAENIFEKLKVNLPIIISGTIIDKSGRLLSGQTIEAFIESMKNENVIGVGLNCSFGAKELIPFIKKMAARFNYYICVYPNAGFINVMGEFEETPSTTASLLTELIDGQHINIVGGCCGTTPEHIANIAAVAKGKPSRKIPNVKTKVIACGLEPLEINKFNNFIVIGERTNVSGSRKFAKLISEKKYEEAVNIAKEQIDNGAQIIDINLDDALLDTKKEMEIFLKTIALEPTIARVPVMIDSSNWETIESSIKCIQGKHVINSINLKEGPEEFKRKANIIKKFGCSVIVMAFDEKGQANSFERKIEICSRAYDILTREVKFPPEDIIFDPNVLPIATGIEENRNYAIDFIKAVKWIKNNLTFAKVSGGISNLSYAFRGNNDIRKIIHSVFLYHAIKAGLDMAILNPGTIMSYEDISKDKIEIIENVIFNRDMNSEQKLVAIAQKFENENLPNKTKTEKWQNMHIDDKLIYSIVEGIPKFSNEDIAEALDLYGSSFAVIEGPLMQGMNKVGELFAQGNMFLPQVLRSTRVMQKAIMLISSFLQNSKKTPVALKCGKVLLATVKGDVHDIGKNIVSMVLRCNNFEVIDLGIMIPSEQILQKAQEINADIIGLSGLITPSLGEMANIAEQMSKHNMTIPLLIGGAATSKLHTAVKIDPKYPNKVIYVHDAAHAIEICKKLMTPDKKIDLLNKVSVEYSNLRNSFYSIETNHIPLTEARNKKLKLNFKDCVVKPRFCGIKTLKKFPIKEVRNYINWTFFFKAFEMNKNFPDILSDYKYGNEAKHIYKETNKLLDEIDTNALLTLNAVFGIFPANSDIDDIIIYKPKEPTQELMRFNFMRQQTTYNSIEKYIALSDYIAPLNENIKDYIGAFVATAGLEVDALSKKFVKSGDEYKSLLLKVIADRLVEAFAEKLHQIVRNKYWGYLKNKNTTDNEYLGIRPAIGYPAIPDHSEKLKLNKLLQFEENIGVKLTENYMMEPAASVCGLYLAHPEAKYFDVGKIYNDQLADYSERKCIPKEQIIKIISTRVEQ